MLAAFSPIFVADINIIFGYNFEAPLSWLHFNNEQMILDYENSIRGGITRAICHYVKANNKYMHRQDETKESSYISYLDFKNHHGWALTTTSLRWICIC